MAISSVAAGEAFDVSKVRITSTNEPFSTHGTDHTDAFHRST
tara:strand:- start:553 stop:678 length:126 start_codon:yes stop_codon:yes gene_type:complete